MEVEQRMREGGGKDDRVRHWGLKRDGPKCEFGPMMKGRSEEHTSELQSQSNLVCRLLLEKKKRALTAFVDGDRGGDLILKELLHLAKVDFIARAPIVMEVEKLTQKQIIKSMRNNIPAVRY